jgi:small subunit ribosomal protein S2
MKDTPSVMFVVDLNKEHIAVAEAKSLGIPVVGIADTNVDPEAIEYPIPGNDDAIRSIKLFANLVAEAYLEGAKRYTEKVRAGGGKEERAEQQAPAARSERPQRRDRGPAPDAQAAAAAAAGPSVVKVNKGSRKLVAAGTAEDVEIQMELEQTAPVEAVETPENDAADTTEKE